MKLVGSVNGVTLSWRAKIGDHGHGATAHGGTNGLGVHGPDIECTGANDYTEKIPFGSDEMPAFPAIGTADVTAIVAYVSRAPSAGDPGGRRAQVQEPFTLRM